MKAVELDNLSGDKAPDNWILIPEIENEHPPFGSGECMLWKLKGLNVCCWLLNMGDGRWKRRGPFFKVKN